MMPHVTLIFLLYNARETAAALVESALAQRHPLYSEQSNWLNILFMDDCSCDETVSLVREALTRAGNPSHCTVIRNDRNLGLAATLNKAFAHITTPYGLTCHLDVLFGRNDYVARMLDLMEMHPEAGAITGQPAIGKPEQLPVAEKLNIVCNMMDIFPGSTDADVVPVGFAEGRCDIFRVAALRSAGFWDTTLHASGEDQVLAARMRQNGYSLYQAPSLLYYLSVSSEQNTIRKLLRHAFLFGKTQVYVLFSDKTAISGAVGEAAGANRRARLLLRGSHLAGVIAYIAAVTGGIAKLPLLWWVPLLLTVAFVKLLLLRRHLAAVRLEWGEISFLLAFIPLQDVYYSAGIVSGICVYFRRPHGAPIR